MVIIATVIRLPISLTRAFSDELSSGGTFARALAFEAAFPKD
jgi:hypothetical protein